MHYKYIQTVYIYIYVYSEVIAGHKVTHCSAATFENAKRTTFVLESQPSFFLAPNQLKGHY